MDIKKLENIKFIINSELEKLYRLVEPHIEEVIKANSYVAGGCIYSIYHTNEFKDIDIFFKNRESLDMVIEYILKSDSFYVMTEKNDISIGVYKGNRVVITDNAVSVGVFQLIKRDIGTPSEVVDQFDFKHNMFYLENGGEVIKSRSGFIYLEDEHLRFNKGRSRDICGTIMRTIKYSERGMKIKRSELASMLLQLEEVGFAEHELHVLHSYDDERLAFES